MVVVGREEGRRGSGEGRREERRGGGGGADCAITSVSLAIRTHAYNDLCEMLSDNTTHHELTDEPKPEPSTANICWPSRAHTHLSAFDIHLHVEN